MNKNLILFDVDGTLTLSRQKIKPNMIQTINKLINVDNIDIGIVGGSNMKKQKEQLTDSVLKKFDYIFSENGLVAYYKNELFNKVSITKHLGEKNIKILINCLLKYLANIDIPVKRGTFIEYRNGMINCSPIGRSCSYQERLDFFDYDNKHNIRKNMVSYLEKELKDLNLSFSLGGQISIDIFPKGWDKTYCLQFVENKYDNIYFFGDRTMEGGNDYEIFNDSRTISYTVQTPEDTINYINELFI